MTNTTVQAPSAPATQRLRWGRILIGAVLTEAALVAMAVPLFALVDNPFSAGAKGTPADYTGLFASIAAAALVSGGLFGAWVARPLKSGFVLHGALTGVVATAIYLGLSSIPPNTIPAVVAAYGPFWFFTANGLRIVGSVAGAAYMGRRRS